MAAFAGAAVAIRAATAVTAVAAAASALRALLLMLMTGGSFPPGTARRPALDRLCRLGTRAERPPCVHDDSRGGRKVVHPDTRQDRSPGPGRSGPRVGVMTNP
ncbi:hypothetical protein GCM10023237_03040 [Streptomyces coeruleoprunus]